MQRSLRSSLERLGWSCSPAPATSSAPSWARSVLPRASIYLRSRAATSNQVRCRLTRWSRPLSDSCAARTASRLSEDLRSVMRNTAQPVAIVTTYMKDAKRSQESSRLVHGATLSSFTSVSLDPPLVAFSLKTPSRLAEALVDGSTAGSSASGADTEHAHFVISILSDAQAEIAKAFSVPGLEPYGSAEATVPGRDQAPHPLELHNTAPASQADGVPYLTNSVGAFSCRLYGVLDLRGQRNPIQWSPRTTLTNPAAVNDPEETGSILLVAEIVHVDHVGSKEDRPMVYWNRTFSHVAE